MQKVINKIVRKIIYWLTRAEYVSYSQFGEDVLLRGFLESDWAGRWDEFCAYPGFYVDVGAHDPTVFSNTKFFYNLGWRGINIDASSDSISKFKKATNRDINLNVGVGVESGNLNYYRMNMPAMNSFSEEFVKKSLRSPNVKLVDTVKVPVERLDSLLDKYLPQGQHIDFMSIDCEGLDSEILESSNWEKYHPDYVLIEIHTYGHNESVLETKAAKFLIEHGYQYVGQGVVTSLFKRCNG